MAKSTALMKPRSGQPEKNWFAARLGVHSASAGTAGQGAQCVDAEPSSSDPGGPLPSRVASTGSNNSDRLRAASSTACARACATTSRAGGGPAGRTNEMTRGPHTATRAGRNQGVPAWALHIKTSEHSGQLECEAALSQNGYGVSEPSLSLNY